MKNEFIVGIAVCIFTVAADPFGSHRGLHLDMPPANPPPLSAWIATPAAAASGALTTQAASGWHFALSAMNL